VCAVVAGVSHTLQLTGVNDNYLYARLINFIVYMIHLTNWT